MNHKKRLHILKILILTLIIIFSGFQCADVSPDDAEIIIVPESFTLTGLADEWLNQSFLIIVKNSKGEPLNDVDITISFTFAPDFTCPPSSPTCTIPIATLLDKDKNPQNSPFTAKTGKDGTYEVWVRYWHGAEWKGNLKVFSGTAFKSADFEVKS